MHLHHYALSLLYPLCRSLYLTVFIPDFFDTVQYGALAPHCDSVMPVLPFPDLVLRHAAGLDPR